MITSGWVSPMDQIWDSIVKQTQAVTASSTGGWLTAATNGTTNGTYTTPSATNRHLKKLYLQHFYGDDDNCTPEQYANRRAMELLKSDKFEIKDGRELTIKLPDGGVLEVSKDGSYVINDKDAKVIYRANRVHNFNPFLNASDKIEDFIRFCGSVGVRQHEMLQIPIEMFIAWLVIEAAKADGDPEPENVKLLPDLRARVKPRCRSCQRFISRKLQAARLEFCRPRCFETTLAMVPA